MLKDFKLPFLYILLVSIPLTRLHSLENNFWNTNAAYLQSGFEKSFTLWSYVYSSSFEFGTYINHDISMPYGNLALYTDNLEFSGGYLNHTLTTSFILSYGENYPESHALPENRPLGYSIKVKNNWFSILYADYHKVENKILATSLVDPMIQILDTGFRNINSFWALYINIGIIFDRCQALGDTFNLDINSLIFNRYINSKINIGDTFELGAIFLDNGDLMSNLILKKNLFKIEFIYAKINNEMPFRSEFFSSDIPFYLTLYADFLRLRIFEINNSLNIRFKGNMGNFGLYHYLNGEKSLAGIFYRSLSDGLFPYAAFYSTPDFNVTMQSFGISFGKSWMFSLLHSSNQYRQNYPLDPVGIPSRFYFDSLNYDSVTLLNHSYLGFQFYYDNDRLFIYTSILQNYQEGYLESLAVTLQFQYRYKF